MLLRRYRLHARARLIEANGQGALVCHHPLQWFRLNESAAAILARLDGEAWLHELVEPVTPELTDYLDRLAEQGALRAEYRVEPPAQPTPRIHVIVPAYRAAQALTRCLDSLRSLDYPREQVTLTVVDDATPRPLRRQVDAPDVRWVRLERNVGPGGARNAGVEALGTIGGGDLLAFLDSDCVAEPYWLRQAAALFDEPGLSAVGGSVAGLRRDTTLARYEDVCSPLDMGDRPGRAGEPGMPVPYLPSCNLVLRCSAFRDVGGFRRGWRTGEDVDLNWRLAGAGHRLFYWPAMRVRHDHRAAPGAFFQRRRDYARSEGPLSRVYPERFRRNAASKAFLAAYGVGAAALQAPWPAAAGLGGAALLLLAAPDPFRLAAAGWAWPAALERPPLRTWWGAGSRMFAARMVHESRLMVRQWLLWLLPAAFVVPGSMPCLIGVVLLGGWGEWRARAAGRAGDAGSGDRPGGEPRAGLGVQDFVAGWLWDALAYSLGRIEGLLRAMTPPTHRRES